MIVRFKLTRLLFLLLGAFICSALHPQACAQNAAAEKLGESASKQFSIAPEAFSVAGHPAFVIVPAGISAGSETPWVWYAPTLPGLPGPEEQWMFRKFLDAGIAIAGLDVGESYGSPEGCALFSEFYKELVRQRGFSKKACLLARSRGGLMLYNWAVENPARVACIAGIYPVVNLASYPGLKKACTAYKMTEEQLAAVLTQHNPVDRIAPLAKARVPIYHLHGDNDAVVPLDKNSGLLAERYRQLGVTMTLNVIKGGGHDMWTGWFECQPLVDFVIWNARGSADWATLTEDENRLKIETDKLEAVIPKKNPKHWMTGIEKGSFLDKATGFREIGDGLMVVDWLMEAGSDEEYEGRVIAPDGHGVGRYTWYENETDPNRRSYALMAHGNSHRKRMVEGPQLCHRMKSVQPQVIRGTNFIAVETTYQYEYAAPGRKPGSRWTQLVVFPRGERFFLLMDKIASVNASEEVFLRNDTPGCIRHEKGNTFSEIYLSYLSGPNGVRIPSNEFFAPFPPDLKFGYRRDLNRTPAHFIRAYHLRDPQTGKDGPWLAGLTLEPSVVYEAWCSERPGNIIVMIEEVHGKPVQAGQTFSAAHIVGYFDNIEEMHAVYEKHKGHTGLIADPSGWRLVK